MRMNKSISKFNYKEHHRLHILRERERSSTTTKFNNKKTLLKKHLSSSEPIRTFREKASNKPKLDFINNKKNLMKARLKNRKQKVDFYNQSIKKNQNELEQHGEKPEILYSAHITMNRAVSYEKLDHT